MAKRPVHFRSADGSALPLALRLQTEGHPVTFWTAAPEAVKVGHGLVPRAVQPPRDALIVFDATGMGAHGASLRKAGRLVIGGNPFERELELDRPAGAKLMRAVGIHTPETFPFRDIPAAIKFLDKQDGPWFVKVSGDTVESATHDAPDPDEMIRYLQWVQRQGSVTPFELQRRVTGTEISCNGWFNGQEFVPPFDLTMEDKKFMNHDLGPRTGCESCVVWHAEDTTLADLTVGRVAARLTQEGYVGPVDLNAMIQSDGTPLGLEWTARLGFDATQAWMRLFDGDLGEQLEAFAAGELAEWEPAAHGRLAATLRVSIPPYPTCEPRLCHKNVGLPLDETLFDREDFDPVDVMEGDTGPVSAGASGIVGTVGTVGDSLKTMREDDLLPAAFKLEIPNKQFKTHVVRRFEADITALGKHGLSGFSEGAST